MAKSTVKKDVLYLDASDVATMLAALRMFQQYYEGQSAEAIRDVQSEHFIDHKGNWIMPLGTDDIDVLCESLNFADVVKMKQGRIR
jgi:hypothetical protein